jgi:hypothetical protein
MKFKKLLKVSAVVGGVVFVLIQFIQPERTNPPVDQSKTMFTELNPPENIKQLLERGCKDCHSNETHWPFYAYVAPVSWLVADDVEEGRKHFNMSEWGTYTLRRKFQRLSGINELVLDSSMPLPKYIPLHPDAKFTQAERDTLAQWAQVTADKLMNLE